MTYSQVLGEFLSDQMVDDPRIMVLTPAMLVGSGLVETKKKFPNRVFDLGITEPSVVSVAGGMATQGIIPVVCIYSTFLQRAFDQVIEDVCLQDLPVVFVVDRGGIVGPDGVTHQGSFDLSYLSLIPNLVVSAPKDENELRDLLLTGIDYGHPFAVRYPRANIVGLSYREPKILEVGKGEILKSGKNTALLAIGSMVYPAIDASVRIGDTMVANMRFVKPIDEEIVNEASKCKHIVTAEDNTVIGGLGDAVSRVSQLPVKRLGIPDKFIEHGSRETLLGILGLDTDGIVRKV